MNNNEPITLGKVKKGGAGKPILVIIILLFIGSAIFLLPTVLNYFGDYSIIDLIKDGNIVDFIQNHDQYMNGNVSLKNENNGETTTQAVTKSIINNKTTINENGFTLSDFNLTTDNITFKVTVTNPIDFDNENYYLILTKNDTILSTIKLVGNVSSSGNINFKFKNRLDTIVEIEGNVKKYNENDYPKYTLSSDESGLASFTCKLNNDSYEYIFDNNNLASIRQKYKYLDTGNTDEDFKEFEKYSKLSTKINNSGNESTITENNSGFIFTTNIKMSTYKDSINNNYYSYNTSSNKIKFDMDAKGYDCK